VRALPFVLGSRAGGQGVLHGYEEGKSINTVFRVGQMGFEQKLQQIYSERSAVVFARNKGGEVLNRRVKQFGEEQDRRERETDEY